MKVEEYEICQYAFFIFFHLYWISFYLTKNVYILQKSVMGKLLCMYVQCLYLGYDLSLHQVFWCYKSHFQHKTRFEQNCRNWIWPNAASYASVLPVCFMVKLLTSLLKKVPFYVALLPIQHTLLVYPNINVRNMNESTETRIRFMLYYTLLYPNVVGFTSKLTWKRVFKRYKNFNQQVWIGFVHWITHIVYFV